MPRIKDTVIQFPSLLIFGAIASFAGITFVQKVGTVFALPGAQASSLSLSIRHLTVVILLGFWMFYITYVSGILLLLTELKIYRGILYRRTLASVILRFLSFLPFVWVYKLASGIEFSIGPAANSVAVRPLLNLSQDLGAVIVIWLAFKVCSAVLTLERLEKDRRPRQTCFSHIIQSLREHSSSFFFPIMSAVLFLFLGELPGLLSSCGVLALGGIRCNDLSLARITLFFGLSSLYVLLDVYSINWDYIRQIERLSTIHPED